MAGRAGMSHSPVREGATESRSEDPSERSIVYLDSCWLKILDLCCISLFGYGGTFWTPADQRMLWTCSDMIAKLSRSNELNRGFALCWLNGSIAHLFIYLFIFTPGWDISIVFISCLQHQPLVLDPFWNLNSLTFTEILILSHILKKFLGSY